MHLVGPHWRRCGEAATVRVTFGGHRPGFETHIHKCGTEGSGTGHLYVSRLHCPLPSRPLPSPPLCNIVKILPTARIERVNVCEVA